MYKTTALIVAAQYDNLDVFKAILRVAPDSINIKDTSNNTMLHHTGFFKIGNAEVLKFLLEEHKELVKEWIYCVNYAGETALMRMVKNGNFESVRLLYGAEPEQVSILCKQGYSVLDYAVKSENNETIEFLLRAAPELLDLSYNNSKNILSMVGKYCPEELVKMVFNQVLLNIRKLAI